MIHLQTDTTVFNLRVVAVFTHGDYVLIHRAESDYSWSLPGGRAEFGESTRETVAREMQEELKVKVEVGRLLWVLEYFFEAQARAWHEVGFYYQTSFSPDANITPATPIFYADDMGLPLILQWVHLDELQGVRLYPTFLKTALRELPETTQHVICREED